MRNLKSMTQLRNILVITFQHKGSSQRIELAKASGSDFFIRHTAYGYSALLKRYVGTTVTEKSGTACLVE